MIAAMGGITAAAFGLLGQFVFPTTGITTDGKATLLAIDDASLPLRRNLCYYLTRPTVRKDPVLTPQSGNPNAPDNLAAHFYGTVLLEQGRFRMWYSPCSRGSEACPVQRPLCYAESDDGVHWVKPVLGQFEFNGSRENNGIDLPGNWMVGATVIRDDDDPDPARRYKLVYETAGTKVSASFRTAVSPDGIRWTASPDVVVQSFAEQSSFYKHNGMYIVNTQGYYVGGEFNRGRVGQAWMSVDFNEWLQEAAESFALPNPLDAGKPLEQGRRDEVHLGIGAASLGNALVGLYGMWHNDADFGKITCDLGLVVSNDGLRFREPVKGYRWLTAQESPVTPVPGKDYPTILCQANGILNVGDETRIYHGRWRNADYDNPAVNAADYYGEVALATIPRDRWGALGLFPGQTEGSAWSCPVTLPESGCELTLNADGAEGMRVEVADARFTPIGDYSGEMSGVPQAAAGLDVPVKWPKANLAGLGGKTVRFHIQVEKVGDAEPRLYCLYLTPPVNSPKAPMAQYEAEEFEVTVGGRTIIAKILSPPKEKLAADPALLLDFGSTADAMLFSPPYCRPAQYFVAQGHRAVSFDLPAHGSRVDPRYGEGIGGWRNAFVAGDDVFTQFTDEVSAVIDECIKRGWARPGRIAIAGTSRGGYMALRALAADDRIAAGAGFAPCTDWRDLAEFSKDRENQAVADIRLSRFAKDMVGKYVFLAIGGNDARVNTQSCRHLAQRLAELNERAGFGPRVWYTESDDPDHTIGDRWYRVGEEFLLRYCTTE
jgi:alpha-beta hydrolase superfamily lysophospholipase